MVNHSDRDCSLWLRNQGSLSIMQQFGPWLRAQPRFPHKQRTITVEGSSFTSQRSSFSPTPTLASMVDEGPTREPFPNIEQVLNMEGISLDPVNQGPNHLISSKDLREAPIPIQSHVDTATMHESRKGFSPPFKENFPSPAHPISQLAPTFNATNPPMGPTITRTPLSDISNAGPGPKAKDPKHKAWKRINKNTPGPRGGFRLGGSGIGQIRCPSVENKLTDNPFVYRLLIGSSGRVVGRVIGFNRLASGLF